MKTKLLLTAFIAFLFCNFSFSQTSGGPDAFGYTWKNQAAAGGPVYAWKDIKSIGTAITGFGDDNQKGPFNLGFSFRYYWTNYNKIWVGSNGWIAFQNIGNIAAPFPLIPAAAAPNNYLAPMTSDLTFTQTNSSAVPGATAWYWTNNADTMIVQFDSVPYWVNNAAGFAGRYTFQAILSAVDSSITYQYKKATAGTPAYSMTTEGLTTGIENSTGQIGLQVLTNVFPTASTAVKFDYPSPVTYQVFDATPAWNQNADNGGFFVSASGAPKILTTDLANAGNQALGTVTGNGQVQDASLATVWTSSVSVTSLAIGADTVMKYPTSFSATTPGTYLYKTTSASTQDINAANNVTDCEMVVVDTTQTNIALSYYTTTAPTTQNAWGGNGGQGIYIEPPFYPAIISSIDVFVTSTGTLANLYHVAQIVDDNGPGNSPGTVLYTDSIAATATTAMALNNIPVTKSIVILSGGVYIAYLENGDSLSAVGTDGLIPLSNRNYEIIGGAWATYRNNSAEDLMIAANIKKYWGAITTTSTADACPSTASGSATVTVSGGITPYTYAWSTTPVQTTAVATGLAAGTYSVLITDSLGITATSTAQVYSNVTVNVATTNISCFGGNNGTATGSMVGGTGPFTYVWNTTPVQTTATISGLSAGIYGVTITDAGGCINMGSDTVLSPTAVTLSATAVNATCIGTDGSASSTVSGGTPAYTYAWSTSPVQTTASITGLVPGGYTLAVTDANGCTKTANVTITTTPFAVTMASTPVSCYGQSNGTATANSTGGTAPYTYVWTTNPVQNTQTATGLGAGTYSVSVTDSKGCSTVQSVSFTNPAQISTSMTTQPATPPSYNNGSAIATVTGGTAPFTYVWSPSGGNSSAATGLTWGNYTVCVTDSKGCSSCDTANVMGNGINELFNEASITISPNPFTSMANVNIDLLNPSTGGLFFVIYDIYGREVKSIDLTTLAGSGKFDFVLNRGSNITSGLYFYKLQGDNKILSAGKIIVQ